MEHADTIWTNARLATLAGDEHGAGDEYGAVEDGLIAVAGDSIVWAGPRKEAPALDARRRFDAQGRWITPGLIDAHTHLVFGGDRAEEFALRLGGATYEEIARAGGGIKSTVAKTRAASDEQLFQAARGRLTQLIAEGVTTVEIKSGYGLDTETELKMLRVARRLGRELPVTVRTSFLGAHALPAEYQGRSGDYIDLVSGPMMDAVVAETLADAVDVFAETIAFTAEEAGRVFEAAKRHGLPVKLHADQLSDQGGAALAARFGALSAEHLEHSSEAGIAAMGAAGTVAMLLPGAFYFLRDQQPPPIELMRKHKVPMAIASDCNPGSSPAVSLLLMMNMACTLFRMTPAETLAGVTRNAAKALGLNDRGVLAAGKRADFVLWDIAHPAELSYWIGAKPAHSIVQAGVERDAR